MLDKFKRNINYLRISVTDRCNLRCTYCMPEKGIKLMPHSSILSFEEIVAFVQETVNSGISKVRITGGEPLVRKDIVKLVSMIGSIEGLTDLSMTTNGILLEKYAEELAKAGLNRINISLDTIDEELYHKITRKGQIKHVFKGIEAAKKAGLLPIKINAVLMDNPDEDTQKLIEFCKTNELELRFIHQMNLKSGQFSTVEGGEGGNCKKCNRLRLTANGKVKPCLFSDLEYDIRELGNKKAIELAIENKPKSGSFNHSGQFYNIGG